MDQEDKYLITFSWYDYALFSSILALSTVIGVYFGFFGSKQSSAVEYLKGGKKMKVFPIAMSQISSQISGILLLAVPADIYFYGTNYAWGLMCVFWVAMLMPIVYMPVFYKMQLTSVYEYLEARFDSKLRLLSSFLYFIASFLYLPIVIYVPALAFSQATNINVHLITPLICVVCLFYTTIGGIKAVVWTDTLQFAAMIGGIVAVMVTGINTVGGFGRIYDISKAGDRLDWDFELTIFKRDTVWAHLIGMSIHWTNNICINQGTVQKFLSLPKMKDINKAFIIFMVGEFFCRASTVLIGLIMYARYYDCDPFTVGTVKKHDQMLPYFIMDVARNIKGLPGLFISGIFCASLSTLSAVMNSLGGTIYQDFVAPFMPKGITQKQVSNVLKLIVFIVGVLVTCLIFVIERLGGIFPLAISFAGLTGGPLLGVFTLGLLVPSANARGAFIGAMASLILMSSLFIPTQWYRYLGYLPYVTKPLETDGCVGNYTNITSKILTEDDTEPWKIFKISPYFYTLLGSLIVFLVGIPISWYTNKSKKHHVNRDLISPVSHWLLPKERANNEYCSVDTALKIIEQDKSEIK